MKETWLNPAALMEMDDNHLERYTHNLDQTLGRVAIFRAQVQEEWDRRYPPQEQQ